MKAYVDGTYKQYDNLRRGRNIQERLAKQLHREANVPEGACGFEELKNFHEYLGPKGCKIIVADYVSCACIFQGNVDEYKVMYLLKHENRYNDLRSMITFMNRSYFCPDCCKGYNTEDAAHHSCLGRNCASCQRTRSQKSKGGCPDFTPGKKRTIHCKDCQRDFYGPDCFKAHKEPNGKKRVSLCQKLKKCLHCCKGYTVNPKQPHKCYHDICRHCHDFVDIYKHKCYIQRVEDESSKEVDVDEDDDDKKKLPPLTVFGDIECLIEPTQEGKQLFIADLIRYATEEDPPNVSHVLSGDSCIQQFIKGLNKLTEVGDKQRDLFVIFHNLKGFDGVFIIEELYRQGIKVENQLTNGAKTLSFQYWYMEGRITFKDYLCFLPMPLTELPETFNLVELHKGFFSSCIPYKSKFNLPRLFTSETIFSTSSYEATTTESI